MPPCPTENGLEAQLSRGCGRARRGRVTFVAHQVNGVAGYAAFVRRFAYRGHTYEEILGLFYHRHRIDGSVYANSIWRKLDATFEYRGR